MFYDKVKITVIAGKGGNGCASFRREKFIPRGGPNGGSGGNGGNIVLRATARLNTLNAFRYEKKFEAPKGNQGLGKNMHGKQGSDRIIEVPVGTVVKVKHDDTYVAIADLVEAGQEQIVARGGKGGLGNAMLATPHYQAPRFAELGEPGEERELFLELKLIADVGLVGYPNVGKSTLISVISNAKPKIADYPFTTVVPNLGVASYEDVDFVVADIPGLIEGAHQGKGLGHEFLRHIERTRAIVHILDGSKIEPKLLVDDLQKINEELQKFDEKILTKPMLVIVNKIDVLTPDQLALIQKDIKLKKAVAKASDFPLLTISAVAQKGLDKLLNEITAVLREIPKQLDSSTTIEKIFHPLEEDERNFWIEKAQGIFKVHGRRAERIAITTDLTNEEAVHWMHDRLKSMGVYDELEKQGIEPGDAVVIGAVEFEWD